MYKHFLQETTPKVLRTIPSTKRIKNVEEDERKFLKSCILILTTDEDERTFISRQYSGKIKKNG